MKPSITHPLTAYPSLAFILIVIAVHLADLDVWLADFLYRIEGGAWTLRYNHITEDLIHVGGRTLTSAMAVVLLALIAGSYRLTALKPFKIGLWYVFLSAASSALLINVMKSVTQMACPWDLSRYGGTSEYVTLLDQLVTGTSTGACFPAGHASAAYCWFGLFFFARAYFPKWQSSALLLTLVLGLTFGIAQQLRGAHFLSHDLWTVWICWTVAYGFNIAILSKNSARSNASSLAKPAR
ncbi:phosphatase PAP2 family protein [Gammaproteobacteria bacterium]|nr:phosphatase PAP2 family protein [Gammaproteobacteria bacterium]MDC1512302.1 phosphatase PAP2 family protein [Gammaproteobacteria bacterium]